MAKEIQASPGLSDEEAIRLMGRLIEEQVVVLDNALERLEGKQGDLLTSADRGGATAAATASMMSISLAVNHTMSRVDAISPQLLNVMNNGLFQYTQKLMTLLPHLDARVLTISFTTSIPPAATLSLDIRP